jgi:hypothetical protein
MNLIWRRVARLIAALVVCTAAADTDDEKCPAVSFGTFPYPIKRFYFFSYPGTPVSKAKEMNGPGPDDFPPQSEIFLEDARRYPSTEKGPVYMILAKNVVRVYNITAVSTGPYKTIQPHIRQLRSLLRTRPPHVPSGEKRGDKYTEYVQLPDYPPRNAGHLVQVKLQYVDAPWGTGLCYVTQFVQGIGEWPNNEQLFYLFQGLSKDEKFNVAADFRITHPALEKARAVDEREADELTEKLAQIMAKDTDEAFTSSLKKIRDWMSTLKIE